MQKIRDLVEWLRREEGQGLVEYVLIIVLISIAAIIIMGVLGGTVNDVFSNVVSALTS